MGGWQEVVNVHGAAGEEAPRLAEEGVGAQVLTYPPGTRDPGTRAPVPADRSKRDFIGVVRGLAIIGPAAVLGASLTTSTVLATMSP